VKDLNLVEAKMNFVKAWQSLPDYGVSLFVVRYVKTTNKIRKYGKSILRFEPGSLGQIMDPLANSAMSETAACIFH
jgi:hypothetical protein